MRYTFKILPSSCTTRNASEICFHFYFSYFYHLNGEPMLARPLRSPIFLWKKRSLILGMSIENVLEMSKHPISSSKELCSKRYSINHVYFARRVKRVKPLKTSQSILKAFYFITFLTRANSAARWDLGGETSRHFPTSIQRTARALCRDLSKMILSCEI